MADQKTYNGGKPCPKCENVVRYTTTTVCVHCEKIRSKNKLIPSKRKKCALALAAQMSGQTTYQGKACRACGNITRYVKNQLCCICFRNRMNAGARRRYADNPNVKQKHIERSHRYRQEGQAQQWPSAQRNERDKINDRKRNLQKYGLDLETFHEMRVRQNDCCLICHTNPYKGNNGYTTRGLSVDHCHVTGKIRGLLCHKCNRAIGLFGDKTDLLRATQLYLMGIITKRPLMMGMPVYNLSKKAKRHKINSKLLEQILIKQGTVCAICCGMKVLCVDHDHHNKRIRGFLCHQCNTGLGLFKDNQKMLESAIKYLEACEC